MKDEYRDIFNQELENAYSDFITKHDEYFFNFNNELISHYLNLENLKHLIDHNALKATNLRYLTDYQELDHVFELIKEILTNNSEIYIEPFLKCIKSELKHFANYAYIVSFYKGNDLLSVWRSFGENCNAYSISGITNNIEIAIDTSSAHTPSCGSFYKVIYDNYSKNAIISDLLYEMIALLKKYNFEKDGVFYPLFSKLFVRKFYDIFACLKKNQFRDEHEIKYIINPSHVVNYEIIDAIERTLKYDTKSGNAKGEEIIVCKDDLKTKGKHHPSYEVINNLFVPHINIPFSSNINESYPFSNIKLGPMPDQELNYLSLCGYIDQKGIIDMQIDKSEI